MRPSSCVSPLRPSIPWMNHVPSHFMAIAYAISLCSSPHCLCPQSYALPGDLLFNSSGLGWKIISIGDIVLISHLPPRLGQVPQLYTVIAPWPTSSLPGDPSGGLTLLLCTLGLGGSAPPLPGTIVLILPSFHSNKSSLMPSPILQSRNYLLSVCLSRISLGFYLGLFGTNGKLWAPSHN